MDNFNLLSHSNTAGCNDDYGILISDGYNFIKYNNIVLWGLDFSKRHIVYFDFF